MAVAAYAFLNKCIWTAVSSGTGDFVVSAAAQSGYTPAQCSNPSVVTGQIYRYFATNSTEHEEGEGAYTAGSTTLARTTIRSSSNFGGKVSFSAPPTVYMGGPTGLDMVSQLSVVQFGAIGDGSTTNTTAIQAALTAANAAGLSEVYVPNGTYLTGTLTIPSGVTLMGEDQHLTILKRAGTMTDNLVNVASGASNYGVKNLTLDYNSGTDAFSMVALGVGGSGCKNGAIQYVTFQNGNSTKWALRADWTSPFSNLLIDHCQFLTCPGGGILIDPPSNAAKGCKNITISNNFWDNVGANLCQLSNSADSTGGYYYDVHITNNVMQNVNGSAAIPMEPWGLVDYVISGNVVDTGTRGIAFGGSNQSGVVSNNVISNQTAYGMECDQGTTDVTIVGNSIIDCAEGIAFTATATYTNVSIVGNLFHGTGLASNTGLSTIVALTGTILAGLFICDNVFVDLEYVGPVIKTRSSTGNGCHIEITDNSFLMQTAMSAASLVQADGDFVMIRDNKMIRTANYSSLTHYDTAPNFIYVSQQSTSTVKWICEKNRIAMLGTVHAGDYFTAIGNDVAPAAAAGIEIRGNIVEGPYGTGGNVVYVPSTSTDGIVTDDNDLSQASGPTLWGFGSGVNLTGDFLFNSLSASQAGTNVATAQPWFPGGGPTGIELPANSTWEFDGVIEIARSAGTTSHTTSMLFGGTAGVTSCAYLAQVTQTTGSPLDTTNAQQFLVATAAATVFGAANTVATENLLLHVKGIIRISTAGTLIPQFKYSTAPGGAPTIAANSFFTLSRLGDTTANSYGNWS